MATAARPNLHFAVLTLAMLAIAGCERNSSDSFAPTSPVQHAATPAAPASGGQALAELHALDPRQPVPLQPMMAWHQKQNMQEHLVAIQRITNGLAREDWDAIAAASGAIESSPQTQQMCEHMGAGADGFTELALEFHLRADAIGAAARKRDAPGVLQATAHTLEACTSCHARFRQEVVDRETWTLLAGQTHEPVVERAPK
jgi:hypothetical protein